MHGQQNIKKNDKEYLEEKHEACELIKYMFI